MEAYIVGGVRTAIGRFNGALAPFSAIDLGATVIRDLVRRTSISGEEVEEVVALLQAGVSQKVIAMKFGVGKSTISDIHTGKTWVNVNRPDDTGCILSFGDVHSPYNHPELFCQFSTLFSHVPVFFQQKHILHTLFHLYS